MGKYSTWYKRVAYFNRPDRRESSQSLDKKVEAFLREDNEFLFAYKVMFILTTGDYLNDIKLDVYLPNEFTQELEYLASYNSGQLVEFKELYNRVLGGSTTGSADDETNLLHNGAFIHALDGWVIDSEDGAAVLSIDNGILTIEDTVVSTIRLRNTKTTLVNLQNYKVTSKIEELGDDTTVLMQIGTQYGVDHLTVGVKNENIISAGTTFYIEIRMTAINQKAAISYILVGK